MTDLFKNPEDNQDNVDYAAWAKEKYGDDPQALAKAAFHKDKHIERIERENGETREELNKRITMEELLAKIESNKASPNTEHESREREQNSSSNPNVSIEELEARLEQKMKDTLHQSKQQDVAKANVDYCHRELEKAWGPNYREKAAAMLRDLDTDATTMGHLAEKNPKLFLSAMLKGTATQASKGYEPPRSSFSPAPTNQERNYAYYEKIRKEDRNKYWSREVQDQMVKDVNRLGDDFYSKG